MAQQALRILILAPYPPGQAPSQRFRFEHYLEELENRGHSYKYQSFWDERTWAILYQPGQKLGKIWGLLKGYLRRCLLLFELSAYDRVYIHREVAPLGPPFFEWCIAKLWRKRIIFDYDDAIWLPNTSQQNKIAAALKWHKKTASICSWAWRVSAGNTFLCDYARQAGASDCRLIPTVVDTQGRHNRLQNQRTTKAALGWTGSHSTLPYLEVLRPVLQKLAEEYEFDFYLICNSPPEKPYPNMRFIQWREEREIEDLLLFHIGLMPLEDTPWAKGKCAFKAIQYMALGIVPLLSPVGANTELVEEGKTGFFCQEPEQWLCRLKELLNSPELRQTLGQAARKGIELAYSVASSKEAFFQILEEE